MAGAECEFIEPSCVDGIEPTRSVATVGASAVGICEVIQDSAGHAISNAVAVFS